MTTLKNLAVIAVLALAACSTSNTTNPNIIVPPAPNVPTSVTITPAGGVLIGTIGGTGSFTASESGYTGTFTATSSNCAGIATFTPASGTGPSTSFTVTAVANGSCQITVTDTTNHIVGVANVSVNTGGGGAGSALTVNTNQLSYTTAGAVLSFTASESGYSGAITASNGTPSCAGIATFSPASGTGPSSTFNVTSVAAGQCQIKVTDASAQTAAVNVTVTTTGGSVSIAR